MLTTYSEPVLLLLRIFIKSTLEEQSPSVQDILNTPSLQFVTNLHLKNLVYVNLTYFNSLQAGEIKKIKKIKAIFQHIVTNQE
uniref:Uncharacterized protein n=1 Tax=Anguilla anguilla TaxID=7936 RepID=A0A0E9QID3_ANGAN